MKMTVLLAYQKLNDIFTWLMAVLVAILYLIMGATLDLEIVKGIIKKPVGPAVGVFCQYVLMPAVSGRSRAEGRCVHTCNAVHM